MTEEISEWGPILFKDPKALRNTYICRLPVVPPSTNVYQRLHWAKQVRIREPFQEQVWAAINEKGNRCPRPLRKVELRAVLTFKLVRGSRDGDNFHYTLWKFTQDVLVRQGVIPDDSTQFVTAFQPIIRQGDKDETLLMITPIEEEAPRG